MGNYFDNVKLTLKVPSGGGGTAVDFSCDIRASLLNVDTPEEVRKRLCGTKTVTGTPSWTLDLEYDQNWAPATAQGLSHFLNANAGELADFTIEWPAELTSATGKCRIKDGPFGGTAGEIAEGSITLGVDGEPTFAAYTPTATVEEAVAESEGVEV